ncbi:MAG: hypothetical protein K6B74_12745 [Ruminococcus sp.]|nr:hypothetical protein [Ruminococcus sp.]
MILASLIFTAAKIMVAGAVVGAVVGTVAHYWEEITSWLTKAIEKVKRVVEGIVYGCKVLAQKIKEGFKEISRHYSKKGTQWEETTVTRKIPESEVPPEILEKVGYEETDLSDDYEEALELSVS